VDVADAVGLLMTPEGRDDPYPTYDALRAHGPLVRVQDGFYVASGHAVIDEMLRDPRMRVTDGEFLGRIAPDLDPGLAVRSIGRSMLQTNAPDHTRMRRLAAGAFTARRVAALRDTVAAQATTLANYLGHLARSEPSVDFVAEFSYPLPVRVICSLLGVPAGDQAWFRERAGALTAVLEPVLAAGELHDADRAVAAGFEAPLLHLHNTIVERGGHLLLTAEAPPARDMPGRVLSEGLDIAEVPRVVASYESGAAVAASGGKTRPACESRRPASRR